MRACSESGSDFVFDGIVDRCYKCNKIILNCGRSYIDSPVSIKNKKATSNPKINDDKCFQYALTIAFSKYSKSCRKNIYKYLQIIKFAVFDNIVN